MKTATILLGLFVSLATLSTFSCATTPEVEAVESFVQTSDGALLSYRKVGDGEEVLVVPSANWLSPDIDRLAEGRTLIYYDLRRRGRSGKASTARMDQDLQDLEELRSWFGLEQMTILGLDYSAALAAQYAVEYPNRVRQLVLVSPMPPRKFPYWSIYDRVFHDRVNDIGFQDLRELNRENGRRHDPKAWADAYRETVVAAMMADKRSLGRMEASVLVEPNLDPEPLRQQYLGLLRALGDWDMRDALGRIQCPTLVIFGLEDPVPMRSSEEWVESIPGARGFAIPSCGRLPWVEKPKAFYGAVGGFLE